MKKHTLALLACACAPAFAQTTHMNMPEGSRDASVAITFADVPRAEGSTERRGLLLPSLSVQWSNGMFLEGLGLGMHLSQQTDMQYGPLLSLGVKQQRSDAADNTTRLKAEAGAFFNYQIAHNISLNSRAVYGGGDNGRGLVMDANTRMSLKATTRSSILFTTGLTWANRDYMQSYFGVTPEQASNGPVRSYQASSGIKNLFISGVWQWDISPHYTFASGVGMSRLYGSAAESPLTERRNGISASSTLSYRF